MSTEDYEIHIVDAPPRPVLGGAPPPGKPAALRDAAINANGRWVSLDFGKASNASSVAGRLKGRGAWPLADRGVIDATIRGAVCYAALISGDHYQEAP